MRKYEILRELNVLTNLKMQSAQDYLFAENVAKKLNYNGISLWFKTNHLNDISDYYKGFNYIKNQKYDFKIQKVQIIEPQNYDILELFNIVNDNQKIKKVALEKICNLQEGDQKLNNLLKEFINKQKIQDEVYESYIPRIKQKDEMAQINLQLGDLGRKELVKYYTYK